MNPLTSFLFIFRIVLHVKWSNFCNTHWNFTKFSGLLPNVIVPDYLAHPILTLDPIVFMAISEKKKIMSEFFLSACIFV